jgi:hypothetical protein
VPPQAFDHLQDRPFGAQVAPSAGSAAGQTPQVLLVGTQPVAAQNALSHGQ